MQHSNHSNDILRILDANLNRLKEGLRVIEDIMRFMYDNKECTYKIKNLRHKARLSNETEILRHRNITSDIGKDSIKTESVRESVSEIMTANFHRVFESARVLEEMLKLESCAKFGDFSTFKHIRYECYNLHKYIICEVIQN